MITVTNKNNVISRDFPCIKRCKFRHHYEKSAKYPYLLRSLTSSLFCRDCQRTPYHIRKHSFPTNNITTYSEPILSHYLAQIIKFICSTDMFLGTRTHSQFLLVYPRPYFCQKKCKNALLLYIYYQFLTHDIWLCAAIIHLAEWHMNPGGRLNKKDGLTRCGDSHVKDKTS